MDNNKEYSNLFKNLYDSEKGIIELINNDFEYKDKKLYIKHKDFINKKGFIIFYAAWCTHCIKLSDVMYDLQNEYINSLKFGAVNVENLNDKNDITAVNAKVSYLPHLMYINKDNSLTKYNFTINEENITFFINVNYI
jgi:thiol-disulfide isomerase/thioredoxin